MSEGLEFARWLNDRLAEAVAKHPKRLVALASVPMQDSAKAAAELERAITKLGLRGARSPRISAAGTSTTRASIRFGRRPKPWMRLFLSIRIRSSALIG